MKKAKVVLAGALVLALGLVMGCKMGAGDGEVTGTKWDSTLTVDASESAKEPLEKKYRRFWKQLGTSEKVTKVQTTLSIDTANSVSVAKNDGIDQYASVGFIFNMHEYKAEADGGSEGYEYKKGDALVEFLILGYQPGSGRAYLDHYWGIPKKGIKSEDGKTTLDTDLSAIAPLAQTDSYQGSSGKWVTNQNIFSWQANDVAAFISKTSKDGKTVAEGFTVRVEDVAGQAGVYSIKLQNVDTREFVEVAQYNTATYDKKPTLAGTKPQGGVGVYANVPKQCRLVASYVQDKDNTVGLYVEEE